MCGLTVVILHNEGDGSTQPLWDDHDWYSMPNNDMICDECSSERTSVCNHCDETFYIDGNEVYDGDEIYCDEDCAAEARDARSSSEETGQEGGGQGNKNLKHRKERDMKSKDKIPEGYERRRNEERSNELMRENGTYWKEVGEFWQGDQTMTSYEQQPCCTKCEPQGCMSALGCGGVDKCSPCDENFQPTGRKKECEKPVRSMSGGEKNWRVGDIITRDNTWPTIVPEHYKIIELGNNGSGLFIKIRLKLKCLYRGDDGYTRPPGGRGGTPNTRIIERTVFPYELDSWEKVEVPASTGSTGGKRRKKKTQKKKRRKKKTRGRKKRKGSRKKRKKRKKSTRRRKGGVILGRKLEELEVGKEYYVLYLGNGHYTKFEEMEEIETGAGKMKKYKFRLRDPSFRWPSGVLTITKELVDPSAYTIREILGDVTSSTMGSENADLGDDGSSSVTEILPDNDNMSVDNQ